MAAEKAFENKIKKYLENNGYWHVKFFANSYTKVGIPDILSTVNGYFLAIEVKAPTGKPSELQKHHIKFINSTNAYGVVVRPDQWFDLLSLIDALNHNQEKAARKITEKINSIWKI